MKRKKKNKLATWMLGESIIIVISSVCIFALVEYITNIFFYRNESYQPIDAIGMFLPMSLIMFAITSAFSKKIYNYITILTNAITEVVRGNFNITLDRTKGGPLQEVFSNFNIMLSELNSVQTLREDFINNFSHEFKTPITSIHGFAKLLLNTNVSDEEKTQYLTIIADESARLSELANMTLLMSKLDSQQLVMDKEMFSLDEQIKQCAILLSTAWIDKNIDLSAELPTIKYYGNEELLKHVWINLINNAIRYTPENGEITILMKETNHNIMVSFTDSGIGISDKVMKNIFDKYYQGDSSRNTKGLGLGLSIVKRIIDLSGGNITVKSKINEGSTFTVTLPKLPIK
jgi:signal transduction histidine kinase